MPEIEIKILEINTRKVRKILKEKAKFVKKVFQRNIIYDNDYTKKKGVTVRLRKEGKKTIFTVKSPIEIVKGHKVRKEFEIEDCDFKEMEKILSLIDLKKVMVGEARREYYNWHGCSVEIVEMPKIPVFLEIEGSERDILKVAKKLGYSEKDYFAGYVLGYYKIKSKKLVF